MLEQSDIADEIRARYVDDDRLPHPAAVAVSEREGAVSLRGTVRSFHQRKAAIEIAKNVDGVRAVTDGLNVDPRDHWQDAEIRGTALQALVSRPDVPADQIDATVDAGWLTLKGEVKHQYDSDAAFEAVSGLSGVGGITNEIKVITAGGH
jgi:osmotically-inducible protein OsmY